MLSLRTGLDHYLSMIYVNSTILSLRVYVCLYTLISLKLLGVHHQITSNLA